mmetsp:Transcript_16521/g.47559  ORF Transcript_16521/g.47559 Transcript_16521/m.47559 type:complete len:96 (+) Transcript_16521:355-642(+)
MSSTCSASHIFKINRFMISQLEDLPPFDLSDFSPMIVRASKICQQSSSSPENKSFQSIILCQPLRHILNLQHHPYLSSANINACAHKLETFLLYQ